MIHFKQFLKIDKSMAIPSENSLEQDLLKVSVMDHLPSWAELEPGSILYEIDRQWEQDKPKRYLSQKKIAEEIERITGRKYTHRQFKTMFRQSGEQQTPKEIPKDIAEAYLNVAFNKWSFRGADQSHTSFQTIFPDKNSKELNKIIKSICNLIYKDTNTVRCKPSKGLGPNGFVSECRDQDRSIILAAQSQHILGEDPVKSLYDWKNHINTYFQDLDTKNSQRIHVWVFREPNLLNENETIQSEYDIGFLKTAISAARTMCIKKKMVLNWEELSKRLVVAILMKSAKNKSGKETPIIEKSIFPKDSSRLVVTAKQNDQDEIELEYNQLGTDKSKPSVLAIKKLGPKNNESYENLYRCCKTYIKKSSRGKQRDLLNSAIGNGWKFMNAEEFLSFKAT